MPRIDWDKYKEAKTDSFDPIPKGKYLVKVAAVKDDRKTREGDEMWGLKLQVNGGSFHGRVIWDNIVFSESAMNRAKLICSRLGLGTEGVGDLTPEMLVDRECFIDVEIDSYTDKNGKVITKNVVPFAGYERAEDEVETKKPEDEDNLPF